MPEYLHGVKAASVGLRGDDAPVRARERSAQGRGQALTDGATREAKHCPWLRAGRLNSTLGRAGGGPFVHGDRILRV